MKKMVIIGSGPGGYVAAVRAAQHGADVTVVEKEALGGVCLNWGCIPTKVMVTAADLIEKIKKSAEFGIERNCPIQLNFSRLMQKKQSVVNTLAAGISGLFKRHRINYLMGKASIEAQNRVSVFQPDGNTVDLAYDSLILSPGSSPASVHGFPFDAKDVLSSNDVFEMDAIPASILILGGGVIGCEFACIFNSLGAKVTIVEALSRLIPIPTVDESISKVLLREMKKKKIDVILNRTINRIEKKSKNLTVHMGASPFIQNPTEKDTIETTADVEKILVCIGRKPCTEGLGLEKIGVKCDGKGWIEVNDCMETDVHGVYAVGDILGPSKIMLAHVASAEGIAAAENAMGFHRQMKYDAVPSAIFTFPEIGTAGLTEIEAKQRGFQVRSDSALFRSLGKAHAIGEISGEAKIISDAHTGRILGIHVIGAHATELIGEASLAIQTGCSVAELTDTLHAHPTLSEIFSSIIDESHFMNRKGFD